MSAVVTLAPPTSAAQTEAKMEIVVNRAALLAELTLAQGITSTKAVSPILMNILIEANDDSLTIIATNLDQSVKTSVPAKVKTPGIVTLPARKFFDYVKLLQAEEIKITALDNGWVQIRSGRSNTKMPGMDRANFPVMPEPGAAPRFKIPVDAMLHMIGQTSYAVCREESRYTLAGALFCVSSDKLMMVATDGHRLAYIEKNEKTAGVEKVISALISIQALADLRGLLSSTEETVLEFCEDNSTLYFAFGHRKYSTRKLTGSFPNFKAVIPTANNRIAILATKDLETSVRRVAQFADERGQGVKLTLQDNALKIASKSTETGESEEVLETVYSKEPVVIGFNASYLLDIFKALAGKGEVRMELKDGSSSALLRPEVSDPEYTSFCVLMPIRV
jgi:DNA polymerase-3 subunit beta